MVGNYTKEVYRLLKNAEQDRRSKVKKKANWRRGKKSFYENAIEEEGASSDSNKSDIQAQKAIKNEMADNV